MSSLFSRPPIPSSTSSSPPQDGAALLVWRDFESRSGPEHMALDEILLKEISVPVLRLYQWQAPELTIGFFTPRAPLHDEPRPITRRWTGGGIVEHGKDVTLALSLPRPYLSQQSSTGERYRVFHQALVSALHETTRLSLVAEPSESKAIPNPESPGSCFSEPVAWDVLDQRTRSKIAGGAQRRSRQGILHQGSLRLPEPQRDLDHPWTERLVRILLENTGISPRPWSDPGESFWRAHETLLSERYRTEAWNQRF